MHSKLKFWVLAHYKGDGGKESMVIFFLTSFILKFWLVNCIRNKYFIKLVQMPGDIIGLFCF